MDDPECQVLQPYLCSGPYRQAFTILLRTEDILLMALTWIGLEEMSLSLDQESAESASPISH